MTQSIPPTKEDIKKSIEYKIDFVAFIKEVLELECKKFHKEWIELFEENKYISLLAPRAHGKTTLVGAYLIWRIVKNPNIRILLITINYAKAKEIMGFIQRHLEGNTELIKVFGPQRGYTEWSNDNLRVLRAGKTGIAHKEPTLTVFGITAGMVGGHYEVIVLDDVTDRENSRLEHRRRELERWYNATITPMLEPDGKIISIGTTWHEDDIHSYFRGLDNYTCNSYKAIIEEPNKDGKPAKVLWPERWPYEKLMKRKSGMGSVAFQMQYQNEIISLEDSPIKQEWVELSTTNYNKEYRRIIDSGGILQPFMGVDLASKGKESDYFTITIIGVHEGKIFVLDGLRTNKASMFKQFELIKSFDSKWQPSKIGIEQAAQQKMIVDQLTESTILPIIPIKTSIVNDSMSRVQRLSVLFETGRVYLNPKLTEWADEMVIFPRGKHNDSIDSLCFAIQSSQTEEEKSGIDWTLAADMVSAKSNKDVKHVGDRYWLYKS